MNIRSETINLLEENIGGKLLDISLGNDILNLTPKENESKNKQVELYQIRKFLHSKIDHQQNGNITYEIVENNCKLHI